MNNKIYFAYTDALYYIFKSSCTIRIIIQKLTQIKGKFSNILIAVDGSETSMNAAGFGIRMAKKDNAQLIALHVVLSQLGYTYSSSLLSLITPSTIKEILERSKQEAQQWFDKISEKANANSIQLKTEVVISPTSVVGAIVDYAERGNVDLIVLGTRGRSGFKKMLLGSVITGIVTYATCPIMVVK